MRTFTLIALAPAAVSAFAPKPAAPRAVALKATVEETVVDVIESIVEDVDVKDELLSVVGAAVGDSVSSDLRDEVSELLVKMEAKNPTEEPATSALLNGVWDVAYQGYAPGPLPSPTRPLALALYAGGFTPGVRRSVLGFLCRLDGVASMASRRRRRVDGMTREVSPRAPRESPAPPLRHRRDESRRVCIGSQRWRMGGARRHRRDFDDAPTRRQRLHGPADHRYQVARGS